MRAERAAAVVAEARARGANLTLRDGRVHVSGDGETPVDLVNRLRAERAGVVQVLSGDACAYCGETITWPDALAVVFGTGEAACVSCYDLHLGRPPSYWWAHPLDATERQSMAEEGVVDFEYGDCGRRHGRG